MTVKGVLRCSTPASRMAASGRQLRAGHSANSANQRWGTRQNTPAAKSSVVPPVRQEHLRTTSDFAPPRSGQTSERSGLIAAAVKEGAHVTGHWDRSQQQAFERARRELEALCHLRGWPKPARAPARAASIEVLERARMLLHRMGRARGTFGGRAVAELAARGYAVSRLPFGLRHGPSSGVMPLDSPGLVAYGRMLPGHGSLSWRSIELRALEVDIGALPIRHWGSAHEILEVRRKLAEEGLVLEER
jgi:hypothetical protein